jgi:protein-tyrosine sulfotransferase
MNKEKKPELVDKLNSLPMAFILGLGRSGTTLLQGMLDAHPNVVAPPESKFILLLYPRFHHIKKWDEKDIHDFVEALYIDPLFGKLWAIDKVKLLQDMLSIKEYADYAMLCKLVCYNMRENKENVTLLTFKVPLYTIFLSKLKKIFPDARFVHLVRDPRDNLYSHIKSYNIGDHLFVNQQWVGFNSLVEKNKQMQPSKYFTIYYEEMVKEPENILKSLSGFLGITYNSSMLQQKLGEYKNESEFKMVHESLLSPVNTSNVGKWKNKLSPQDIVIAEAITGKLAKSKYGYEMNAESNSVRVSKLGIIRSKYVYLLWKRFTLFRYSSLRINLLYSKIKRRIKGDKLHIWNYF